MRDARRPLEGPDISRLPDPGDVAGIFHNAELAAVDDPQARGVGSEAGLLKLEGSEQKGRDGPVPNIRRKLTHINYLI